MGRPGVRAEIVTVLAIVVWLVIVGAAFVGSAR